MTRVLLIGLFCIAAISQALAADPPQPLTIRQARQVLQGLLMLDGYQKIIKDGQIEKTAVQIYDLGGGLRVQIGQSITALRPVDEAFQHANLALIHKYSDDGNAVANAKMQDYTDELNKTLDGVSGVTIPHIKTSELKLDTNPIQGSVLSLLNPILDP